MIDEIIKLFFVLLLADVAFMITRRNIRSLFLIYAVQSFLISIIAFVLYLQEKNSVLLLLSLLTIVSKSFIIPYMMHRLQKKINLDMEFKYFTPTSSMFISILLLILIYSVFSKLLSPYSSNSIFILGSVIGISLVFMGMMIMLSRKKAIVKTLGYLTMENGVLLFGLFLSEIPFIIEVLITLDLIMVAVLSALFAFGVDSTIEEFHSRLNPLKWFEEAKK